MNKYLSDNLCGYRKGFSSQHALISMIENWRKSLDNKGFAGAILMDLSKAFDCMDHELLIAKLYAYGFSKQSLKLIHSYLESRWQRVEINNKFSSWTELLLGVPQGSVLGPLLFNIYLNDLLWFTEGDVCNLADDSTLYSCDKNLNVVLNKLETDSLIAINWFKMNHMKLNTDKCKLIVAGHKAGSVSVKVGESNIYEQDKVELLGITIDNKLTFQYHLEEKLKKANSKLAILKINQSYLSFQQNKIVLSSFVHSQLSYAPLVWMFHSKEMERKINRAQSKALRILYDEPDMAFIDLLKKDNAFSNHEKNIQILLTEMFKAKNNIEPSLLKKIFEKSDYQGPNLRTSKYFKKPHINSKKYGQRSLQHLGTNIWTQLPNDIQNLSSLIEFKLFIKSWRTKKCPCELCSSYIGGIGVVDLCSCQYC